jgi:uncharacterized protein (UPF0332 family)
MKVMNFNLCQKHYLKRIFIDKDKIKSMLKIVNNRLNFIKEVKNKKQYSSIICEQYYEIIKELLIALLISHGFKSKNHECLISFFKHSFPEYEYESIIIYNLKIKRNKLDYEEKLIEDSYGLLLLLNKYHL